MNACKYTIQTFWEDDDGGYIATVPDLPGCSAFGETVQEAVAEVEDAIEAWIEAAKAAGNPIPQPSRPAMAGEFSGKVLLRMPRELHRGLSTAAEREGVSLNQYMVYLLAGNHVARAIEKSTGAVHRVIVAATAPAIQKEERTVPSNVASFAQPQILNSFPDTRITRGSHA